MDCRNHTQISNEINYVFISVMYWIFLKWFILVEPTCIDEYGVIDYIILSLICSNVATDCLFIVGHRNICMRLYILFKIPISIYLVSRCDQFWNATFLNLCPKISIWYFYYKDQYELNFLIDLTQFYCQFCLWW